MKKFKLPIFLIVLVLCAGMIFACGGAKDNGKEERTPEYLTILGDGEMKYSIIRPDVASDEEEDAAVKLRNAFKDKYSVSPDLSTDWIMRGETLEEGLLEILVGDTNREESKIVKNSLDGDMYAVVVLNNKIVICASKDEHLDAAVQYFIDTYITPNQDKITIEATTNEIAVKSATGWLMARTLEIEILATCGKSSGNGKAEVEVIAAVNYDDFTDVGFEIELSGASGSETKSFTSLKSQGKSYTAGGVTYTAKDYAKSDIVTATLSGIDAVALTKMEITPYVVEFGNTLYGLEAFACAYNGDCETISSVEVTDGVYKLTNPAELYVFANYVNSGHRTLSADLMTDADLTGVTWTPIASSTMSYKGAFNGNGHTVSGMYVNSESSDSVGFFGCIGSEATVKDLHFADAYVFANNNSTVGIIAGENRGIINGCSVKSGSVSTTDKDGKTVCEYTKAGSMQGIGGIVGLLNGKYLTSIENTTFGGTVDVAGKYATFVGGIAGKSVAISGDIINCTNTGKINVSSAYKTSDAKEGTGVGGIVGSIVNGMVAGSSNKGEVNGSGETVGFMGGIVGNVIGMGQVVDCSNSGNLTSTHNANGVIIKSYVGGIVGVFSGKTITDGMVLRSYNSGKINAGDGYAGGIVGQIYDCRSYIMYCYNVGEVRASSNAGGIIASAGSNRTFIMNCYNAGTVDAKNASGIIGFAAAQFNETYKTDYSDIDIYRNYTGNYYLTSKTSLAYDGNKESAQGGCDSIESLTAAVMAANAVSPHRVEVHEYYKADSKSINSGLPVFEYQNDATKVETSVARDLYFIHATNNSPDDTPYYYVNRYTDYMEDNGHKMTAAEFAARLGETTETPHNIVDETGAVTGTCNCTCFPGDHHFTITRWCEILDDVNNNLQSVADWANRGEIRHIGYLKADTEQSDGSVAVTWRITTTHKTLSICFNVMYYKSSRCDGATVHEMAHAQLLDGSNESWLVEGQADFVKHNYYEGSDRDNYKWKEDDYQAAYTPTATCLSFLANQYGWETSRIHMSFATALGGSADTGWVLGYGATYQELWDLFGEAGKYNKNAYFKD